MGTANVFLMRDFLGDPGTPGHHGSFCLSPDMICHSQVADPKTYFVNNYNQDPNEKVKLGSAVNFIYARAKNITSTKRGGYIHVYRSSSSLFMQPSIWKNNKLQTAQGNSYITLDSVDPGYITVGDNPFILEAIKSNLFCMVGIVSENKEPVIPSDFRTYNDFIMWVTGNQNVCVRNFTLENTAQKKNYERIDTFSNPEDHDVLVAFKVTTKNLPAGTTFGVKCDPLNVDSSQKVDKGKVLTASGICPANFNGLVTTYGILPNGVSTWPNDAVIMIDVYVEMDGSSPAIAYAEPWENFSEIQHEIKKLKENSGLVKVGSCTSVFIDNRGE